MNISKEEHDRLLKNKLDWEKQAQECFAVAEEMAVIMDLYIEEYRKLKEYRTPMKTVEKPYLYGNEHRCPRCDNFLGFEYNKHKKFCEECGQALKYKEEE